ncbi:MAG TPA: hypothetical protein VII73_12405 [Caulobacteraceae bacterium]
MASDFQQAAQYNLAQPPTLMSGRDANLVDPEFRELVRMNVADGRCETDDYAIVEGGGQVMSRIA